MGTNGNHAPRAVQMTVILNPESGGLTIQYPGIARLGAADVLMQAARTLVQDEFAAQAQREASKVKVAGASVLRVLPAAEGP